MFGRSKSHKVLDRVSDTGDTVADLAGRAASGAGQMAGQAVDIASSARDAAAPVVRVAAATASDKLSVAAERAAVMLADAAERLADAVPDGRLTDASQSVADSVRPRKRSRVKTLLVVAATAGGAVALLRSPLVAKLRQRLFGPPDDDFDDEAESITLPAEDDTVVNAPVAAAAPGASRSGDDGQGAAPGAGAKKSAVAPKPGDAG